MQIPGTAAKIMHAPVNTRFMIIAAGILLIVIAGINPWKIGEIQPYDNVTVVSPEYYTDVTITDNGNFVGGVFVCPTENGGAPLPGGNPSI